MKKDKIITITILGLLIVLPLLGFFTFKVAADVPSYVGIMEENEYAWDLNVYYSSSEWVQWDADSMSETLAYLYSHDDASNLIEIYSWWATWGEPPPQSIWPFTVDLILPETTTQLLLARGIDDMITACQVNGTAGLLMPAYPHKDEYYPMSTNIVNNTSNFAKQSLYGGIATTPYWIMEVPFAPTNISWGDFATECQAEIGDYWGPIAGNTTVAAQANGYIMQVAPYGYINNTQMITINVTYTSDGVLTYHSIEYGGVTILDYVLSKAIEGNTITITSPTSSDLWNGGDSNSITWTSTGTIADVKIELFLSDVFVMEINSSTTNDGDFLWTIPKSLIDSTEYQIKITDVIDSNTFGFSDYFETYTTPDHLTMLTPDSSTSWERNTTQTIKWKSPPTGIPKVKVELYWNNTLNMTLASNIQNDEINELNWTIPGNFNTSSLFQIKVTQFTNASEYDFSDYFEIFIPSITVTSPNSSSSWAITRSKSITWTSKGLIDNVAIHLYLSSLQTLTISANTSNDGEFLWVIPSNLSSSTEYQIKITDVSNSSYYDYSDNFKIYNPIITITSPISSNYWEMGTTNNITWTSSEVSANVKIELYLSDVYVEDVTGDTPNNGEFEWTLPTNLTASTEYQIKIIDLADSDAYAISENFEITESTDNGESGGTPTPPPPLNVYLIITIGAIAAIGVTAAGAFIFLRKRKMKG